MRAIRAAELRRSTAYSALLTTRWGDNGNFEGCSIHRERCAYLHSAHPSMSFLPSSRWGRFFHVLCFPVFTRPRYGFLAVGLQKPLLGQPPFWILFSACLLFFPTALRIGQDTSTDEVDPVVLGASRRARSPSIRAGPASAPETRILLTV